MTLEEIKKRYNNLQNNNVPKVQSNVSSSNAITDRYKQLASGQSTGNNVTQAKPTQPANYPRGEDQAVALQNKAKQDEAIFKSTLPVSATAVKLNQGNANTNKFMTGINPNNVAKAQESEKKLQNQAYNALVNSNATKNLQEYASAKNQYEKEIQEPNGGNYLEYKALADQTDIDENPRLKAINEVLAEKNKKYPDWVYGVAQVPKTFATHVADAFVNVGQFAKEAFKDQSVQDERKAWTTLATFTGPNAVANARNQFKAFKNLSDEQIQQYINNYVSEAKKVLQHYNKQVPDNITPEYAQAQINELNNSIIKENKLEEFTRTAREKVYQQNEGLDHISKKVNEGIGTVANMTPTIAANAILPGSGMGTLFAGSAQSSKENALNQGASYEKATQKGILEGALEVGTEMIGGERISRMTGIPSLMKKIGFTNPGIVAQNLIDLNSEGLEEAVSTVIQPFIDRATINPNAPFATFKDVMESYFDSFLPTLMLNGVSYAQEGIENYKQKSIQKVQQSNMTQQQKQQAVQQINQGAEELQNKVQNSANVQTSRNNAESLNNNNDLFSLRNFKEVGNKTVNAYQYDNPEVKPFFQAEAKAMLKDLTDTIRGERYYDDETGWGGIKRSTTNEIAELLDGDNGVKLSYDDIRKGLNAIIEDNGAENNAKSKRIEFMLDQRLRNGYTQIDGFEIPPDQDYLKFLAKSNPQYSLNNVSSLRQSANNLQKQGLQILESTINIFENIQNQRQGLNIEFDTKVQGNGVYNVNADGTRTVRINPNSPRALEFTLVHELGHDLKAGDVNSYNELQNYILDYAKTKKGYELARQALGDTYVEQLGNGNFNLNDEVANDILGQAIGNQEFLNSLAKNKPNIFQRIYNWFKNVLLDGNKSGKGFSDRRFLNDIQNKFRIAYNQAFNGDGNTQTEYSIGGQKGMQNAINQDSRYKRLENNLNRAQMMVQNGVNNETIRRNTNWFQDKNGDWKFEFSDKDMSLKQGIRLKNNTTYKLGDLLEHDTLFLMYPQLANYDVNIKNMNKTKGNFIKAEKKININSKLKTKMAIQSTLIHEIQHAIQNIEGFSSGANSKLSKLAYYNNLGEIEAKDTQNRYIQEYQGNLNRNIIPPESSKMNPTHHNLKKYLNNRTTFDKFKDGIYKYLKDRGVVNDSIFQEIASQDSSRDTGMVVGGRTNEIQRGDELRERRNSNRGLEKSSSFSLSENSTDNQGRQLTKGQQEYFKDSKVRDEKGNLKVVYHGSNANFTEFKRNYNFFTDNEDIAKSYTKNDTLYKGYANIERPFTVDANGRSFEELEIDSIDFGRYNVDDLIKEYGISTYKKDGKRLVHIDEITSLIESLNDDGKSNYDGIIIDNIRDVGMDNSDAINGKNELGSDYIVFNSNQFKNITNKNPTNNPDIRYSQSNNQWQNFLDQNFNLMPNATRTIAEQMNKQIADDSDTFNLRKKKAKSLEEIADMKVEDLKNELGIAYKHKKDRNTDYTRKFFENVESSKIISQQVKDRIDITTYERKSNEETLAKVNEKLDEHGDELIKQWQNKTKNFTDEDVALGAILIERYQQRGDIDSAVDVVQKLADMGTEVGRAVQMYSIFQRLTPDAMMVYQQRKLNKVFDSIKQKKTGEWVEKNREKFKLTNEDAQFIQEQVEKAQKSESEEIKQRELSKIENRINDKIPPEAGQSIKALRRIAMLFNPKTQVRNVVGNALIMPVNTVADVIGTQIDKAIAKKTGVRTTNYTNVANIGKGMVKGVKDAITDYKTGTRTSESGSKYEFEIGGKAFNENTKSKTLNAINNKLNWIDNLLSAVMSGGDRPFYEAAYKNSIEGQMKANNVKVPTQEMIDIAVNEALSRTWNDNNKYTKAVLKARSAFNDMFSIHGFGIGDMIIPFAKTPANLTKAMVEYSPAGFIESLIDYNDMRKAISRGEMTAQQQKKFVTSTSKAIAGTILYAIAGTLIKNGAVTGSADKDKDVANFEKNVLGIQPYSIKIGDRTYTYSWANPINYPLTVMADTYKMSKEKAKLSDILLNALEVGGDTLLENSFLSGVQEVLGSSYNSSDSFASRFWEQLLKLPESFVPTLFSQFANLGDNIKRQTYEKGDPIASRVNAIKSKIPGLKNTLAPQINTFGEEIQNYGGDNNPFNIFLNPANVSETVATDTQKELYSLYEATKDKTIFPRQISYSEDGKNFTSQERAEYQKISGKYVSENLDVLFDSNFYKTLNNDDKVELVKKVVSDGYQTARSEWADNKTTKDLAKLKNELGDVPLVDYYNAWIAQKGIESAKNYQGKTIANSKSKNQKQAIDKAISDGLTKEQKERLYGIFNISEKVW